MRGNYTDQNGKKFEVTQQDKDNRIVYAYSEGAGQWYAEKDYLTWRRSGDNSVTVIYEPEEVVEEVPEIIEEVIQVVEEPVVEEVQPEVVEDFPALNEVGEDAIVLPPAAEVEEPIKEVKVKKPRKTKAK